MTHPDYAGAASVKAFSLMTVIACWMLIGAIIYALIAYYIGLFPFSERPDVRSELERAGF